MRIGLFIDTFYPMVDGVINVVDNYAKELLKYGEVTVFCPLVDKEEIKNKPYKIVQCKSIDISGIDYCLPTPTIDKAFMKKLKDSNLDVVHIHSPFTVGMAGLKYAKKKKIPVVATLHSQFKQDFERTMKFKTPTNIALSEVMHVFNGCNECWAVNEDIKKLYVEEYKLTAPCLVVTNGTDHLPVENKQKSNEEINREYGLNADESLYLFVGRINYLKNIDLIANSLKILKDRGRKFKMIFVGVGQDEQKFKELLKDLNLEDRVIMAGKIEDKNKLASLYSRAKLFLFPSLYDSNSLVQIEASCQKTPTLFVYGAKTASLVKENVNGFFAKNDAYSYADMIEKIEANPDLYKQVSENAFKDLYSPWDEKVKSSYERYFKLHERARRKKLLQLYRKGRKKANKTHL